MVPPVALPSVAVSVWFVRVAEETVEKMYVSVSLLLPVTMLARPITPRVELVVVRAVPVSPLSA